MRKKARKRKKLEDKLLGREALLDRYEPLKQFFENSWGQIGLRFQDVRRPDDVREVLKSVPGVEWCPPFRKEKHLGCLLKEGSEQVEWRELRLTRTLYKHAVDVEHSLSLESYPARQRADEATTALQMLITQFLSGPRSFEPFFLVSVAAHELGVPELRNSADRIEVNLQQAREQRQSLEGKLSTQAGCYARREVVEFVHSLRHEVEPRNVAKAMAGLPDYGWFHSFRMLNSVKDTSPAMYDYQLFQRLKSIVQKARCLDLEKIEAKLRAELLHEDCDPVLRSHVKPNWGYMLQAFAAHRGKPFTRRNLPYQIMGTYLENIQRPKTIAEIELAKRSELV